jgi:hypothetical protein
MLESASLFVPLTVVLEFEWVMRGFYGLPPDDFCLATEHLLGMSHVTFDERGIARRARRLGLKPEVVVAA